MRAGRCIFVGVMLTAAEIACGQAYPLKPIRVVTSEVGGGNDFMARLIAPGLAANLGQQVIVENRPSGVIPGSVVAKAPPDGYTLLVYGGTFWLGALLQDNLPYDIFKDFAPIALLANSPHVLVVHPSLPVKSVKELIALAKARPAELNYSSPNVGSAPHLAGELFKSMAGVNIVRVPYRGNGPALTAVIGGQVQLTFAIASAAPQIKSGRVRALAITSLQRSELFPGLPTVAELGLPGYEAIARQGMFAPARTPAAVIDRLNQEVARALNQADVKGRLFNVGIETVGGSPADFAATIKSEMAKLGKVIKEAGIRIE